MKHSLARLAAFVCSLFVLLAPARATWSIVVVDTKTGEVCIASATCIAGFNLKARAAVVRVGQGVAACQSSVDSTGQNRVYIWNAMQAATTPAQMLVDLQAQDAAHQTRQYGIVTMSDVPATFTGSQAALAASGVTGVVGDLRYAIQGNILTCDAVVNDAELALLNSPGDLSQRVMAAMEAARARGGDGRCSCSSTAPMACGCAPSQFHYSAYTAYICIARMGDIDGVCGTPGSNGCANGVYYCDVRAISLPGGPEPIEFLARKYDAWRNDLRGVADHLRTRVEPSAQRLVADGLSSITVDIQLVDVDGALVTSNPATLSIVSVGDNAASVGGVTDHGGGHLSFPIIASTTPGTLSLAITVQHGAKSVRLWPNVVVPVDTLTELHSGFTTVSATSGATVPLTLNLGAAQASVAYHVLGSASGTTPGVVFQGQAVPLNCDTLLRASVAHANNLRFQGTAGVLDALGRGEARFVASPSLMQFYVGRRMDWAAVLPGHVTNVVGFDVLP